LTESALKTPAKAPRRVPATRPEVESPPAGSAKLGTVIARQIEAEVLKGGWRIGQPLGSEAELMERHKVGRSTLREAIRQLEAHGVVRMLRGVGGGLIVAEEPHQAAEHALTIYLELLNASADELFEALGVLEPLAARLAADRAEEQDVQTLRLTMDRLLKAPARLEDFVSAHVAIRKLVVEMANNPALTIFIGALTRFMVETLADQIAAKFPRANVTASVDHKRKIVDAIVARRPADAENAMRDDLGHRHISLADTFRAQSAREMVDARSITSATTTRIHPKLGQVVAMTIAHEIHRRGLPAGAKLGAEPDLLAKYGVSRAVFREAIRILEVHGVVRTRRGHAGGLLVSEMDPGYAVASAVGFLQAGKMKLAHFREIRGQLAVNCAALAARRIDPQGRERLAEALSRHLASSDADAASTAQTLHELIGELSGNRALSIFNRVVLEVNAAPPRSRLPDQETQTLRRNDTRIVEAISRGDEPLARRRMIEHMHDTGKWSEMGLTVFG